MNTFYLNTGDPAHFYAHDGLSLTPDTWPNTNARIDSVTGISLTNFQKTQSSASFTVQYGRGAPTQYDDYLFGVVTGQHSGSIYVDWINGVSSFTVAEGSTLDIFPSYVTVANIVAQGSAQRPILLRGIGYQGNHAPWLSLQIGQADYATRITHCEFHKNGGLLVQFNPWDPILGGPIVQQNTFIATSGEDLILNYWGDDPSTLPFLNGYDQNTFTAMTVTGSWRCTSEFTILPGRTLTWGNRNPHLPETLDFGSTGGLSIYGTFNLPRIPYLKNARISFFDEGSINGVLKFLESSTLVSHKSAGLLELHTSLSIEPSSSLAFEGDPISFNSSFASLVGKENSHLSSVPSLNFNQGATFVLEPGATLSVREGSALSVFGPLTLLGTSQQPITFEKHPSGSNWLGIHIESGLAVSELRHCVITDAITGVSVSSSRFKLKESTISDCSVGIDISGYHPKLYYLIDTNTVQNCWTSGIVINNADNVTLHDNTISGCTTGLVTTQATSRLYRNVIQNSSEEGVFAGEYSNPRFGDVLLADPGKNVIRNNTLSALHAVNSTPFLGVGCERMYGGWNSVYGDALLVNAEKGAYVSANWNWWGSDSPKDEQFKNDGESWIDYRCWMPYDPNEGMRPSGSPTLTLGGNGGDDPPPVQSITPEGAKLRQALSLRAQGDYRRALVVYANLIRMSPNALEARVALSELRNTFHDFILSSNDSTLQGALEDSLRSHRSSHPNAMLRRLAKALVAGELSNRRDFAPASAEYQQLLQSATSDVDRAICLFALFNINAQGTRDRSEAQRYLNQLQNQYPVDIRTHIASARFASMIDAQGGNGMQKPSIAGGSESLTSLPTEFALVQNYPNPFNPSTTIKYNLPIDAHVILKLYDVLGREMLTLVDEQAKGGYHSTTLHASRFSSGVYFYRMQAGAFAQTRKLLLLR